MKFHETTRVYLIQCGGVGTVTHGRKWPECNQALHIRVTSFLLAGKPKLTVNINYFIDIHQSES